MRSVYWAAMEAGLSRSGESLSCKNVERMMERWKERNVKAWNGTDIDCTARCWILDVLPGRNCGGNDVLAIEVSTTTTAIVTARMRPMYNLRSVDSELKSQLWG